MQKLKPILKNSVFSLENYNSVKVEIAKLKEDGRFNLLIQTKEDLKEVKTFRTEIRTRLKELTDGRIAINKLYFEEFNNQVKDLENDLKEIDLSLKEKIDNYSSAEKAKTIKLTIKTTNLKAIEKIKALCLKENVEFKEE